MKTAFFEKIVSWWVVCTRDFILVLQPANLVLDDMH